MRLFILSVIGLFLLSCNSNKVENFTEIKKNAVIFPDYSQVAIPPNIAPLNFNINEPGSRYFVKLRSDIGGSIDVYSQKPEIQINEKKWHQLLSQNKGKELTIEIFVKQQGKWTKYNDIKNYIAETDIESYLAYRLINTGYVLWKKIGIYQRNLTNFDESPIFENSTTDGSCVNCHAFCNNQPDKMSLHLRAAHSGTVIIKGNTQKKINTASKYTMSAGVYTSWNPNGKQIAYSVNKINQYFTTDTSKRIIVSDNASDIVVYDIDKNIITTSPKISTKSRENTPCWSPDGKWLYFVSAPECFDYESRNVTKYSLLRIAFNPDSLTWGDVDTVISAQKTGLSFSFPRISPDGKYVLITGADIGYFSILNSKSDLYLYNLESKELTNPEFLNSNYSDSYHDWSETGRWFVFSSKRIDGLFSRLYFCYMDINGKVYKPFVMPQKDPLFYKSYTKNYNVPELITGKVKLSALNMRDLILTEAEEVGFDKNVDLDALSGASRILDKNGSKY
jgi:hypothetical protein